MVLLCKCICLGMIILEFLGPKIHAMYKIENEKKIVHSNEMYKNLFLQAFLDVQIYTIFLFGSFVKI